MFCVDLPKEKKYRLSLRESGLTTDNIPLGGVSEYNNLELKYCPTCLQMTNHVVGECKKCKHV